MTKLELAEMLERFLGDAPGIGDREWDNFTTYNAEPALEPYRQQLNQAFGDGWNDFD